MCEEIETGRRLQSAVEALRSEDLAGMPDARIEEDFARIQRASELLEAERLRRLVEVERRGIHGRDGHLSAEAWLSSKFKVGWNAARGEVRMARALEEMPGTREALSLGKVSMSGAKVLASAREADASAFRDAEPELLEAARTTR